MHLTKPLVMSRLTSLIWLLLCLQGCASLWPIAYDTNTYANLSRLQAEAVTLLHSFDQKPATENKTAVATILQDLQTAYQYELDKGAKNQDMVKQFDDIMQLFQQDVSDYQEYGPGGLGKHYFREAAKTLGQAFDIAIATEKSKNSN
jgi:hypothetical protein